MRTLLAGERTLLSGGRYGIHLKVETTDADGTWQDLTALDGIDWVNEVSWSDSLDQAVMSGTVTLHRAVGTASLAPLMSASLLNRDAAAAYAPLLNPGHQVRISVAALAIGMSPLSSDWREVFLGRVDEVDSAASADTVGLAIRDLGAELQNRIIETVRPYGSDTGVAVETVMQQILDDNDTGVTLSVPVSPSWFVTAFEQAAGTNVFEALRALALQIGWDVRYRYDASHVFRLTLWQPDRTVALPLTTFSPDEYLAVHQVAVADADVRNVVSVRYPGGAAPVERTDAVSILQFGRRFLGISEDTASNIDTLAEAEALADAALADLASPPLAQQIENLFWWPVELGDYYEWQSNGVHYDDNQQAAVVAYDHRLSGGSGHTTFSVRGKPAGAYRRWLRGEQTGVGAPEAEVSAFAYHVNPLTSEAEVEGTVNPVAQSLKWWLSAARDVVGTDPIAASPAVIEDLDTVKQFAFAFTLPDGEALTLFIQPYASTDGSGPAGLLYQVVVARTPRTEIRFEPRDPTGRIRSDWARVTFSVRPTIPPVPGTVGSGTLTGATTSTLTDATQSWTADQFAYDPAARQFFYVRVAGMVARIIGNSATELQLSPALPAVPSGDYAIYQGATLYALVADGAPEAFQPVTDALYIQRTLDDTVIEFYSEITGTLPEPVQRFTFDPDETPELAGIEAQEIAPNLLQVRVTGFDDDVKTVKVWARKAGWPTVDGLVTGALNPIYERFDDQVEAFPFRMNAGTGTWYFIAIPYNSYKDPGPRVSSSLVVVGSAAPGVPGAPTDAEHLSDLAVAALTAAGVLYHRMRWAHSAGIESPDVLHEVKVYGYRSDEGATAKRLLYAVTRRAWQDSDVGVDADPTDDAEVTAGEGSLQLTAGTDGDDVSRTWYYTVELWVNGALQATYNVARADRYGLNAPTDLALAGGHTSFYGGKPYVTVEFGYTPHEARTACYTELWQRANDDTFDPSSDQCDMIARVKAGDRFSVTKLRDEPPYNAGNPVTQWYYWVRNVLADGTGATAVAGPLLQTFDAL